MRVTVVCVPKSEAVLEIPKILTETENEECWKWLISILVSKLSIACQYFLNFRYQSVCCDHPKITHHQEKGTTQSRGQILRCTFSIRRRYSNDRMRYLHKNCI